jgi:hypothetical protein
MLQRTLQFNTDTNLASPSTQSKAEESILDDVFIEGTVGSLALGAVGLVLAGPVGAIAGGVTGGIVGGAIAPRIIRSISRKPTL